MSEIVYLSFEYTLVFVKLDRFAQNLRLEFDNLVLQGLIKLLNLNKAF